jgi:RNA 2',3'-cyclic 3'-phosphodiesterase
MHRLFFAIFPDPAALAAIGRIAARLNAEKVLRGRWTAPAKYHVTARFLGDHADPTAVIARAKAAAAQVRAAPFDIRFDRIVTFRGRHQWPCVVRCTSGSDRAVEALWRGLGAASSDVRGEAAGRFLPHLTIAYADRMLDAPITIEPVITGIKAFALVDSHDAKHEVLARWPLTA